MVGTVEHDWLDTLIASLNWEPIDEFSDDGDEVVAVRRGEQFAVAFLGDRTGHGPLTDAESDADKAVVWRSAQESQNEQPLGWDPTEFATLTHDQRVALMAD